MSGKNPFRQPGQWYKGTLHVHTTRSDGHLDPIEAAEAYRRRGYHFIAITDHDVITDVSHVGGNGFLSISAVEVCYGKNAIGQRYHLVMLGAHDMIDLPRQTPVQKALERWVDVAPVIFLAHPYCSGVVLPEMMALEGVTGLEIFNTGAHTNLGKGLSTVHWDQLLALDRCWWGCAVDDTHWRRKNGRFSDAFGGWVWVKSEVLDEAHILQALKQGLFYASSGPQIYDFRVEDSVVSLRCSEVAGVTFVGRTQWGSKLRAEVGYTIQEAHYDLTGNEFYIRAECTDEHGYTAWTNPIFL